MGFSIIVLNINDLCFICDSGNNAYFLPLTFLTEWVLLKNDVFNVGLFMFLDQ